MIPSIQTVQNTLSHLINMEQGWQKGKYTAAWKTISKRHACKVCVACRQIVCTFRSPATTRQASSATHPAACRQRWCSPKSPNFWQQAPESQHKPTPHKPLCKRIGHVCPASGLKIVHGNKTSKHTQDLRNSSNHRATGTDNHSKWSRIHKLIISKRERQITYNEKHLMAQKSVRQSAQWMDAVSSRRPSLLGHAWAWRLHRFCL